MKFKILSVLSILLAIMVILQAVPLSPDNKAPITRGGGRPPNRLPFRVVKVDDSKDTTIDEVVTALPENDVDPQALSELQVPVKSKVRVPSRPIPAPSKPAVPAPSKPAVPPPSKPAVSPPSKPAVPAPSKPTVPRPNKPKVPPPEPGGLVPDKLGEVKCSLYTVKVGNIEIYCAGKRWYLLAQCSNGNKYGAGPFEGNYHLMASCPEGSNAVNVNVLDD